MKKKLIEVALPLEVINKESARDKNLSAGHPTTLHYWWAPRPLPACRAVVFSSLVDDPSSNPGRFPDQDSQDKERARLFAFIEELCRWESHKDRRILEQALAEIEASIGVNAPALYDPFCGRGLIPLEGQRLGLEVIASDYNPVAVMIAKTLLEIIPKFMDSAGVNPSTHAQPPIGGLQSGEGLTADIEYYAQQVLNASRPVLEQFFPTYEISEDLAADRDDLQALIGRKLKPMGWLWSRKMRCSNPACGFDIPLIGSLWLSQKTSRKYWLEPVVDLPHKKVLFRICHGTGSAPPPTKMPHTGATFRCPACGELSNDRYVEQEGRAGRISAQLIAVIADGGRSIGRVYLPAREDHERIALSADPDWIPDMPVPDYSQAMPTVAHGVSKWADLFTKRQILTLDTLASMIRNLHGVVKRDAIKAGLDNDDRPLSEDGKGARAYADGIVTFLGLVLGKQANRSCAFCFWDTTGEKVQQPFAQQGIQKSWDFMESNPFGNSSGSWIKAVEYPLKVIRETYSGISPGRVFQADAVEAEKLGQAVMVTTDPPYYDNVGYADLSDFFYIWMRRALADVYPRNFETVLTPKTGELAAIKHRFGGNKKEAERSFVDGFKAAFQALAGIQHDDFPLCLFYAYKQKESHKGTFEVSTGWDTMLSGLLDAGLMVTATWPILSESVDTIKKTKASLSTSIVLVCRKRATNAQITTRREFISELKRELPQALRNLQKGNIAPVDLAQSAIGPGMGVFSRYTKVLEADGSGMTVRMALALINEVLGTVLTEQEGEFDSETRWAMAWFQQYGINEGPFGEAETLSKAKVVSVTKLQEYGIITIRGNKVRLVNRSQIASDWARIKDSSAKLTIWVITQTLIHLLQAQGEQDAASIVKSIGARSEASRDLAYRLYSICERKGWAADGLAYNSLITAWPEISRLATSAVVAGQSEFSL